MVRIRNIIQLTIISVNILFTSILFSQETAKITIGFDGLYTPHEFGNIKHHNMDIYGSGLLSNFQFRQDIFLIVNRMFMTDTWENAAKGGGKEVKDIFGYTHEGYIQYSNTWGTINNTWTAGRTFLDYGFGKFSQLLISNDSRPFDLLSWDIHYKSITGNMTGIQLENVNGKKRFLSLHTLNWNINNKLSLSFSEASVYSGENRGIEWQFFNPVIFWVPERENPSTGQTNGFLYGGLKYEHTPTLSLWAELLIDDYQINRKSKGDLEPNEIGFLGGVEKTGWPTSTSDLWLEYTRITNRTYQTLDPSETYTHRSFPIGHYLGNDFDMIQFFYSQENLNGKLKPYISLAYLRDGANGLDTPWDQPWIDDSTVTLESGYSEPFPTGPITYITEFETGLNATLINESSLSIGLFWQRKENQGIVDNDYGMTVRLWLNLKKTFHY